MKDPFIDKRRNPVNQQRLFDMEQVKEVKKSKVIIDDVKTVVSGDATTKYCLTSKGIEAKTTMSTRNRKILLLIKDGKTSANDLVPHFPLPLKTIMVELDILQKEGMISSIA